MSKIGNLSLIGASGNKYTFEMYNYNAIFKEVPGIYVITKRDLNKKHTIIYIGETENMKERHQAHHKEKCFKKNNPEFKCFYKESNSNNRLNIENDLIEYYNPKCND